MIYIMKNGGHDTYNIKQFTLDTPDDLPNLPTSGIAVGSAALVISTSDVYMLNSKGEWGLIASDAEGILPSYSAEDAGKILEVGDDGILTWAANNALPSVTSEDEGKVLKVDDQGEWVAAIESNTQYTAGDNISIDANNEISAIDTTYSAGANVSISNENVISATDTKYTAGNGIEISEQNVISNIAEGNTDIIAEEYDSTKAYAVGDYCIYEDKLYKCTTAIAASNWLKAPQTLGTFAVTVNSENTDDTYFTQEQNGHWMVISEKSGQTINLNRVVDLTTTYTYGNYYYNFHGFYQPALLPYFNGGYATENEALTDFANHASLSFDTSKWTEVTVGDELKSIKEDIPTYTAGTNIQISNDNVISATDTTYSAGSGITISGQNEISADSQLPSVTSAEEGKVLAVNNQGAWAAQEQETITVKGANGDLVNFNDGADAPLVDCKVQIEAVQSGSGDPSPTNVRPISGWTGANIYIRGFNLWDEVWENGAINGSSGNTYSDDGKIRSKNFIPIMPNINYYLKSPSVLNYAWYDINKNYISGVVSASPNHVRTAPSNAYFFKFSANVSAYNNDVCINVSSSENGTYKPYNSNSETINIDWQSTAGTVYGGYLNVKTGVLTVNYVSVDMGQTNFRYNSTNQYFFKIVNGIKTPSNNNVIANIISPIYKSMSANSIIQGVVDLSIGVTSDGYVIVKDSNYTSSSDFNTAISGIQLVYEITTPIEYNLTPQQINSLLGQNNIWADCGAIDLTYYIQGVQPIIDYIDNSKELPAVSSTDEGKVLTVDSLGNWVASAIPDGTNTNY